MTGLNTLFLCHLTMLHMEEHKYEVVLGAALEEDVMGRYVADSREHPGATYFLGNSERDPLTMPALKTGRRVGFLGDVYRGIPEKPHYHEWPWKGEQPLLANVEVTVERVVAYRHFDLNLEYPRSLTYLLFGAGLEAALYHYQTREPDFDHVVALTEAPSWLPSEQLEAGIHVNFPALRSTPPYCESPLRERTYDVQYEGVDPPRKISIARSVWFSTKITNVDDPCARHG